MSKPSKNFYKELREWAFMLALVGLFYWLGGHILLQRALLYTGIFSPTTSQNDEAVIADYNLDLQDLSGKVVSLEDFRGKTVFLNFWATWCPPCIAEMPGIEALFQKTDHSNIVFVMVSVDDDPAKVEAFLKKNNYSFPVYFLMSTLPKVYYNNSIPRTYILNPEGFIASQKVGMANYNTANFQAFLEDQNKKK